MSFNHAVSNLVSNLKNGQMASKKTIKCESSNLKKEILKLLQSEGYIDDFSEMEQENKKVLSVNLKYISNEPVIKDIKVISTPGKRMYCRSAEIPSVYNGLGMVILSTPKGVLTDYEAKRLNVGGELLLKVF